MREFMMQLAALNRYEGEFDLSRTPEINELGIAAFRSHLNEKVEFTELDAGIEVVPLEEIVRQLKERRGAAYERFMRIGYTINATDPAEIRVIPLNGGSMMLIGKSFHVRFLDGFCSGKLVEVRDTEGHFARPRFPIQGQIGFDCTHDRSVLEGVIDKSVVLKALAPRRQEWPTDRLSWQVFPHSSIPLVRETRRSPDGCTVEYLTVSPDLNTCDGVRFKVWETGGTTCCTASECGHEAEYYFHVFMDALSLRDMPTVKRFIKPGSELVVDGNVVSKPLALRTNTVGTALEEFKKEAPGWAGGDAAWCSQDEEDATALCHFGGGGVHFRAELERAADGRSWYVLRLNGEAH